VKNFDFEDQKSGEYSPLVCDRRSISRRPPHPPQSTRSTPRRLDRGRWHGRQPSERLGSAHSTRPHCLANDPEGASVEGTIFVSSVTTLRCTSGSLRVCSSPTEVSFGLLRFQFCEEIRLPGSANFRIDKVRAATRAFQAGRTLPATATRRPGHLPPQPTSKRESRSGRRYFPLFVREQRKAVVVPVLSSLWDTKVVDKPHLSRFEKNRQPFLLQLNRHISAVCCKMHWLTVSQSARIAHPKWKPTRHN
jgi:hypothetical protein